ncbi:MAG: spore coat protein [Clostridium sp.]|nr:spore coat protein [Clostridium sp.]
MQLTCGELHNLSELSMSCVNSITNMELYISSATDPELKAMIQEHLPAHIQDYNMKVKFIKEAGGPGEKLNVPALKPILQDFTKAPVPPVPVTPRTAVDKLNDREIATGYLLTLKRAGREYAWSAMEAANPQLREFLKDAFTMSCNHAYDIWQWMVKKGFYPLSPAAQQEIDSAGNFFNTVQQ